MASTGERRHITESRILTLLSWVMARSCLADHLWSYGAKGVWWNVWK